MFINVNSVFEYGVGVSTKIASNVGIPRYSCVDSDAEFVENLRNELNTDYFRFNYAKIGDSFRSLYDYQAGPLILEENPFEIYLVNAKIIGMHWVACVCVSLLHVIKHNVNTSDV
jgi:hypothetical protein